jgi:septum formation protein
MRPPLLLASRSPRRRQLLEALGLAVTVEDVEVEEKDPDSGSTDAQIASVLEDNARRKAEAVLSRAPAGAIVIAADTLVAVDGETLSKPRGPEEARAMLRRLSGRAHQVFTGLALATAGRPTRTSHARTEVRFQALAPEAIERYVATREPYDKAGGYAIQGLAMLFVERIEGSYTNVMGLPLELFLVELEAFSGVDRYRWFS